MSLIMCSDSDIDADTELYATQEYSGRERARDYVSEFRPEWFNPFNELDWFQRGVGLCRESRQYEESAFIADIIHTHIRNMHTFEDEHITITIQDGLVYEPDVESLINDFVFGVDDWTAHPINSYGTRTLRTELNATTPDTAMLSEDVVGDNTGAPQPPGIERQTAVDCKLNAIIEITPSGWTGQAGIIVEQRLPNGPTTRADGVADK